MTLFNTLGWSITEAANRAVQAVHGITALSVGPAAKCDFFRDFTKDSYRSLEIINNAGDPENDRNYTQSRTMFDEILERATPHWLRYSAKDRIWQMFLERYNMRTMQLRANVQDVIECFSENFATSILGESPSYFLRIPLSSEIVVCPWDGGIKTDVVLPPRLMLLDMLLMLNHALACHRTLEDRASETQADVQLRVHARMDAYVRQVLILGATLCEAVLQDYGHLVLAVCQGKAEAEGLKQLHSCGLSVRLQRCLQEWPKALGRPIPQKSEVISDMLALTQFRNRLVHHDGRINCWHAFQLNLNHPQWGFSRRVDPYARCASYGVPDTFVGYECGLAEFCANTTVDAIDEIHRSVFPEDERAIWVKIPRLSDGRIDLLAVAAKEPYVQLSGG